VREFPKPIVVEEDPEATEQLIETRNAFDRLVEFYGRRNEMTARTLWARAFEKVCKLAMLHGISGDVYHPQITVQSVQWARQLVEHLTRRMLFMADNYVYESQFDEKCKKVVRFLRGSGGMLRHGVLLRKCREPSDEFKRIITTLEENGTLQKYLERTQTKTAIVYKLL
jgi:cytosine/adenosine deaminase-related metal-dependent hydrolase